MSYLTKVLNGFVEADCNCPSFRWRRDVCKESTVRTASSIKAKASNLLAPYYES